MEQFDNSSHVMPRSVYNILTDDAQGREVLPAADNLLIRLAIGAQLVLDAFKAELAEQ